METRNNSLGNVPFAGTGKNHDTWRVLALWVDYEFSLIKPSAATQSSLKSALESEIHQQNALRTIHMESIGNNASGHAASDMYTYKNKNCKHCKLF